jgi:hypothetical protein
MAADIKRLRNEGKLKNAMIPFGGENNTLNLTNVVDDDLAILTNGQFRISYLA